MPKLTVHVYNAKTEQPIPNLDVYLFPGHGGPEPPQNASQHAKTDAEGNATFEATCLHRVAVADSRYQAADPNQQVPQGWRQTYSAWGYVAVTHDTTYEVPLKPVPPPLAPWILIPAFAPIMFGAAVIACSELAKAR